jgi:hypothetical protein
VLNDIAGFYGAKDEATFKTKTAQLEQKFMRLEARLAAAPWFDGENFSLVDAVFGPVLRYFDVFDEIADFGILSGKPKLARWRKALAARPSVRSAVSADYPALLRDFVERRDSWLSSLQKRAAAWSSSCPALCRGIHVLLSFGEKPNSQVSAAILASVATVFMLRAVPVLAAGMTSFDVPMPWS